MLELNGMGFLRTTNQGQQREFFRNQAVDQFLNQVLAGRWPVREGRQEEGGSILGLIEDDS